MPYLFGVLALLLLSPALRAEAPVPPPFQVTPATAALSASELPAAALLEPAPTAPLLAAAPAAPPVLAPASSAAKPVTLDLRDMDVVEVLKILSKQAGINVVVGRNVSGKVTMFLNRVDFWEALRTILETRALAYVEEGGVVRVVTASDYERTYGAAFGEKAETRTFSLKNAKARSVKDVLDPMKSRVGGLVVNEITNTLIVKESPEQMARFAEMIAGMDVPAETRVFILSHGLVEAVLAKVQPLVSKEYGVIQADKRTNTLVVTDNPARMADIAAMVAAFDAKNKAVLIEAKIVQVSLGDDYQFGINWERAFHYQRDADSAYAGGAVFNTDARLVPIQGVGAAPVTGQAAASAKLLGFSANLTALTGVQVAGALNFLQTVGKTRILSSPRIIALNNEESKILVGSKEAYVTTTVLSPGGGAPVTTSEQVNFVDVGVKLFVTPIIGADGYLTLKVKPEVSSVESTLKTAQGNTVPIVRVSQAETSLVVKDGVTVLIGGLIETIKADTKSGVPFLSKIPILGIPFRSQTSEDSKTELVIFLTPRIVTGEVSTPESQQYLPEKEWPKDLPEKRGFFRRLFNMKPKKT